MSPVLLVTSAGQVLVLRRELDGRVFHALPEVPWRHGPAAAHVREHLGGEISGLRRVGSFPASDGLTGRLLAARLVGHAVGRWNRAGCRASEDGSAARPYPAPAGGGVVLELTLEEACAVENLEPQTVADVVRAVLCGPEPFDLLLGPYAATPPDVAAAGS